MGLDPFLEKGMLGGLGPLSEQTAALPRDVARKHVLGFWRPETCLPRPISGRPPVVPEIGLDPIENGIDPQ